MQDTLPNTNYPSMYQGFGNQGFGMYDISSIRDILSLFIKGRGIKGKSVSVLYILLILAMKHYFSNTTDIINPLVSGMKSILFRLFYKSVTYKNTDAGTLDYWVATNIGDTICVSKEDTGPNSTGGSTRHNGVPFYINNVEGGIIAYYFRGLHSDLEDGIVKDATTRYNEYKEANVRVSMLNKVSSDMRVVPGIPNLMFPSSNYKRLSKCITNFVRVCKINKSYKPLGILVDGEPGLGKTKFADYMASNDLIENIIRIDMTVLKEKEFDVIIDSIYMNRPSNASTMYVIDELDKYLQYRIETTYHKLVDNHNSAKEKEKEKENNVVYSKKDHVSRTKLKFLYSVLSILEKDGLTHPCVVMFCSNNFDSIFEGIDNRHFESLKRRFMQFKFNRCDRDELAEYLKFYNDKFEGTEFYEDKLDDHIHLLKNNISIPYRDLNHITIKKAYNIAKIVKAINKWKQEDVIISPSRRFPGEDEDEDDSSSSFDIENSVHEDVGDDYGEEIEANSEDEYEYEDAEAYDAIKIEIKDNGASHHEMYSPEVDSPEVDSTKIQKKKIVATLMELIKKAGRTDGKDKKIAIVKNIYDIVGSDDFKLVGSRKLAETMVGKYHEFVTTYPPAEVILRESYEKAKLNLIY